MTNKHDPDLADFDDMPEESTVEQTSEKEDAHAEQAKITYPAHQELVQQISKLEREVAYAHAEMDNLHKRNRLEIQKTLKYGSESLVKELLVVVDSLERALEQKVADDHSGVIKGVELTLKLFHDTLTKFSVQTIDPLGEPFDPSLHEAMSMQESKDYKTGTVMAVLQKGYQLHDRLLRPAMVIVVKNP